MTETRAESAPEVHDFKAEVSRLLHLMVHSVYSDREIFLRELISNAADACEKLRYSALTQPQLIAGDADLRITVEADPANRRLTILDNGIGMSRQELVDNLGTIARSGTRAFLDGLEQARDGGALIGQFGVGFYAAFMVADTVRVVSRRAGSDEAFAWTSDGKGAFEVAPVAPETAPARGTRVELHLSDNAEGFAEPATVERIVRAYSAHIPVPIDLSAPDKPRTTLADGSALWARPKASVSTDDYTTFYRTLSGAFDEPSMTLHYRAEGRHEYAVLLFVPGERPFDLFDPSRKGRIKLYVRRVFITSDAEILPPWLRFVRGVVDSEDLPLNLSREMLQRNAVIEAIARGVTGKLVAELARQADADPDRHGRMLDAFCAVLKEGLYEAPDRRDDLFRIVRFRSSTFGADTWRSLADYVKDMKPNQTAIYYALGESREQLLASPHLEGFARRGVEVLLLTDPVDAFWVRTALGFDGKPFCSVTQGSADLDNIPTVDGQAVDRSADGPVAALATALREALGDRVSDVRVSGRLAQSPVCLVASDFGLDRMAEKLMMRSEGAAPRLRPVLEINPDHALIKGLASRLAAGGQGVVTDAAPLLLGQARILDGEAPDDPAAFIAAMARLMQAEL